VLKKINTALRVALSDVGIKQRLTDLSSDIPAPNKITASGLQEHLKLEINKWGPVIRKAGVSAD
jgi:tripartite-type tricarboxylate transporter receptor subunit TctC